MAIQNRRGPYNKFDPQKLLSGEWAVVTSGDPDAADGLSVYMCFKAGSVKRMATYEDMVENIDRAAGDVIAQQIKIAISDAIAACENATREATAQASGANKAAAAANQSKEAADAAAKRANDAAKLCEDIASGQGWTEVLERIERIETALRNTIVTE